MHYSVSLTLNCDAAEQELSPLAAMRRADGTGGWGIRVELGVCYLGPKLNVPYRGARRIEWRVDGMRHEAWLDGVCVHETVCDWMMDDADVLHQGEDPRFQGVFFSGVVEVTIG